MFNRPSALRKIYSAFFFANCSHPRPVPRPTASAAAAASASAYECEKYTRPTCQTNYWQHMGSLTRLGLKTNWKSHQRLLHSFASKMPSISPLQHSFASKCIQTLYSITHLLQNAFNLSTYKRFTPSFICFKCLQSLHFDVHFLQNAYMRSTPPFICFKMPSISPVQYSFASK